MDIKLDNISLKNGGLHVIILYCMEIIEFMYWKMWKTRTTLVLLLFMLVMMTFIMKLKILKFENLLQNKITNYIKNN